MEKKKSAFSRYSAGDKAFLITGYVLLGLFVLAIIIPMIYIVIASFMDPITLQNKGIVFDLSKWTLTAYERVMSNKQIWVGFRNAVIYSLLFTFLSVMITMLCAYPMSRADFKGRGFFNTLFMITMFFGGGLIPTYLLISHVGGYSSSRVQRLEYDDRKNLLPGNSAGTAGGSGCGRRK